MSASNDNGFPRLDPIDEPDLHAVDALLIAAGERWQRLRIPVERANQYLDALVTQDHANIPTEQQSTISSQRLQTSIQRERLLIKPAWRTALVSVALTICIVAVSLGVFAVVSHRQHSIPAANTPAASPTSSIPSPTADPSPTVVLTQSAASGGPVAASPPAWQLMTLPSGYHTNNGNNPDIAVAPNNGNIAYICDYPHSPQASNPQGLEVLVTHTRGQSWNRVTDIPVQEAGCNNLRVDALNANVVSAYGYLSLDGGLSWHNVVDSATATIDWLASWHTTIYAVLYHGPVPQIVASTDQMKTWHAIDQNLGEQALQAIWIDPLTGTLTIEQSDSSGARDMLWDTQDGGKQWNQIRTPFPPDSRSNFGSPESDSHWHLCETAQSLSLNTLTFYCTSDFGRTWTGSPALVPSTAGSIFGAAIGRDGSLYAYEVSTKVDLFRLPPGMTRWQDLGELPDSSGYVMYIPTTGSSAGGTLWNLPGSPKDDDTRFFVAAMP